MRSSPLLAASVVASLARALVVPVFDTYNHLVFGASPVFKPRQTRSPLQKRVLGDRPFWLPSPSRLAAPGANEDDPDTTIFVSVEDAQVETVIWNRGQGEIHNEDVESLEEWLLMEPDNYVPYINPPYEPERTWANPEGGVEVTVWTNIRLPVAVSHLVLANWVNFLGTHRQVHDTAPVGTMTIAGMEIHITVRPVADRHATATVPAHEVSDDDADATTESSGSLSSSLNSVNSTHFPVENPLQTNADYFDSIGRWGGIPQYGGSSSKRKRRSLSVLRNLWEKWSGHKDHEEFIPKPYCCNCAPKAMVVDLDSEIKRLQLDHLDLTTFVSDDPREHEQLVQRLSKLQGLSMSSSGFEKAMAIASLLQLDDEPSQAIIEELRGEIDGCGCGGNSTDTLQKRKNPKGLANERWEDDQWRHQLDKEDVQYLIQELRKNGLVRVDPAWQSIKIGRAYVSWSSKFSDAGYGAPSREEILPFVRAFYNRVSWTQSTWWGWGEPKVLHWSTSYRDIEFGQMNMRLCISDRAKRCLK